MQKPIPSARPKVAADGELLCASCRSAKFMRWDAEAVAMMDKPNGMNKDQQTGMYYVLRCDYFRLTVFSPEGLRECDAWQAKDVS